MTHAYSELYLNNAKDRLRGTVRACNPAYVAGMSGYELAKAVVNRAYGNMDLPEPTRIEERSPEYWAGWALASYQWYYARRVRDKFMRVPMADIEDLPQNPMM